MVNNKGLKKSVRKIKKHTKTKPKVRKSKKHRTRQKKTKKKKYSKTYKNKKEKNSNKLKQSTLINGGGCGCSESGVSSPFKNYIGDLRNSLSLNKLSGGGYSVIPDKPINGYKADIQAYDDNNPPILRSTFN